ncbi:MAG: arginine--tRNA ligase [Pelagibacteraceae bacterium TMED216]|nr:MAG: arginine--tRNA ligase [Pelagibacteraceae bacterium TMED216]
MNIFNKYKNLVLNLIEKNRKKLNLNAEIINEDITFELPPEKIDSDFSSNICLILSKKNKMSPKELATKIKKLIEDNLSDTLIVEIADPCFLNFKLKKLSLQKSILEIFEASTKYGSNNGNKKYNIEFVSANPTGPMHIGHCRGAIFGDVLSNLLKFHGNEVTREYYVNDYGNQIKNFTKSVFLRIREIKYKETFKVEPDLYPGEYIIDIAKKIINENKKKNFENFQDDFDFLSNKSLSLSMEYIKLDLNKLGIKHDNFFYESKIVKENLVQKSIKILQDNNYVSNDFLPKPKGEENKNWKKIKRLIFKSTKFGDDVDRALQKNDGSWTYFANDIAYHNDKILRNYDNLVNILGADHTGYIKRINAAVEALSNSKTKLDCKVCQLVKLHKNGKPLKMSKRSGDFVTINEVLNNVDKDSIRFIMLSRSNDVELDFDLNKVLEKNKDNHVFYVQYCYARIKSLIRTLNLNLKDPIKFHDEKLNLNNYEINILRKIFNWPKVLDSASKHYEPHRIPFYLYELATLFHSYWSKGNKDEKYKFVLNNKIKNQNTLAVIKLLSIVIKNGMKILNVSLPEKM